MKDKSLKDKVLYKVQFYDDCIDDWYTLDLNITSKKKVKCIMSDIKKFDKEEGLKLEYRIVKLTIKQEVVK